MTDDHPQARGARKGISTRVGVGIGLTLGVPAFVALGIVDAESAAPDDFMAGFGEAILAMLCGFAALVWWVGVLVASLSDRRAASASVPATRRRRPGWTIWVGTALIAATVVSAVAGQWIAFNDLSSIACLWWFALGVLALFRRVR